MTLIAQGKASSWVVGLAPVIISCAMLFIDPTHFDDMLKNQIGRIILGVAVCLEIFGFIIIRRIVNIKFD